MTTGGGYKNPRLINECIKEQVIQRANGICGHCGEAFEDCETPNICHIKRHDEGGSYTLDNLLYAHSSCDSLYDEGRIIHDPNGGCWLHKATKHYSPDMKQVGQINPEFVRHRWEWEKTRQRQINVSDDSFRDILMTKKYTII